MLASLYRRRLARVALVAVLAGVGAGTWFAVSRGKAGPAVVEAAAAARSYAPRSVIEIDLRGHAARLKVRFYRAGTGHQGVLAGQPVGSAQTMPGTSNTLTVRLGNWSSGLYYADVITPGHGHWYAPFIIRPRKLGTSDVLVVLPTNTWQAYNFEDDDSWYESPGVHRIDISRPFIDSGVPPHYKDYDRGFEGWLAAHRYHPDFLSDDDLDRLPASALRVYRMIVFPGHEEYVTNHEYDVIDAYRNAGGHLAFLSANAFFYKVIKHGDQMDGRWMWRSERRPEAALVGAQYVGWNLGKYPNQPYRVTDSHAAPWLFAGTGLHDGSTFGNYGIEVDSVASVSPPGTKVLATIPHIFGPGKTAEMTYYTTPAGAKVFSAGVMNFGGTSVWPTIDRMVENVWEHLLAP